jgi:hypothetical protein
VSGLPGAGDDADVDHCCKCLIVYLLICLIDSLSSLKLNSLVEGHRSFSHGTLQNSAYLTYLHVSFYTCDTGDTWSFYISAISAGNNNSVEAGGWRVN